MSVFFSSCNPSEYHKLLENIIKKQGVIHPTEKGTGGVCVSVCLYRCRCMCVSVSVCVCLCNNHSLYWDA